MSNLKPVALTVLELLAFYTEKFRGSRDTSHAPFKEVLRVHVQLSLETRLSNLKSVDLTVLELLAFNHPKFRESRDPGHAPFSKKCLVLGLTVKICVSKLMFIALTVLVLLTFSAAKI